MAQHKSQLKAGSFRLNMHPADYFDGNPFRSDKPLPPVRKSTSALTKKEIPTPFKPSNPGKLVRWLSTNNKVIEIDNYSYLSSFYEIKSCF